MARCPSACCHDFVDGWDTYTEKPAHRLAADISFADVAPGDYDALIIPGGRAPEFIRNDPDLPGFMREFLNLLGRTSCKKLFSSING